MIVHDTKPPCYFAAILSSDKHWFLEMYSTIKGDALVIESCQAWTMPSVPGTAMRKVNPSAEMESNRLLRLHEP